MIVIWSAPAVGYSRPVECCRSRARGLVLADRRRRIDVGGSASARLVQLRPQYLGPQHCLVQVQLAVKLLHGVRLGYQVDDRVDALGLLVDLVGEPPAAPNVDLVDCSPSRRDYLEELVKRWLDGALFKRGIEDDHHLVTAHDRPCLLRTQRSRSLRDRRIYACHRNQRRPAAYQAGLTAPAASFHPDLGRHWYIGSQAGRPRAHFRRSRLAWTGTVPCRRTCHS